MLLNFIRETQSNIATNQNYTAAHEVATPKLLKLSALSQLTLDNVSSFRQSGWDIFKPV